MLMCKLYLVLLLLVLFSHEATYTHANCAVQISNQEPQVAMAGHEGIFLHKSILSTGGVCGLH